MAATVRRRALESEQRLPEIGRHFRATPAERRARLPARLL
jgi:hypothetical protein